MNIPAKWLPNNKKAAVCFSIDDVHPGKSSDFYEAGGDLDDGALGLVHWVLKRNPKFKVTLFLTADWREKESYPTRRILASIPYLRDKFYLANRYSKGTMQLDKHPEFITYLKNLPNTELAYHGLYHCSRGLKIPVEFQNQSEEEIDSMIDEITRIFDAANLKYSKGVCPPGWNAPDNLLKTMQKKGFSYLASARDIFTPISLDAKNSMSGKMGVSLLFPEYLMNGELLHIPSNFHATSKIDRAFQIIENGGLLSIKAHIIKVAGRHIAYDGVDEVYMNYLDALIKTIDQKYGDDIWWTSMGELTDFVYSNNIQS